MKMKPFTALLALHIAFVGFAYAHAKAQPAEISNHFLTVSLAKGGAVYELREGALQKPVLTARVGAEVNRQWLWSTDYPHADIATSTFSDQLGPARRVQVTFSLNTNSSDHNRFFNCNPLKPTTSANHLQNGMADDVED